MTVKQAYTTAVAPDEYNPKGSISAYTRVQATGFNGMRVFKRVRIGVEFGVSVDTAKVMMRDLREANSQDNSICGRFVMEL